MKNYRLMVLAAALTLILAPAASALAGDFYLTPKIGWASFKGKIDYAGGGSDSESKNMVPFGLAFGYDFKPASDIPVRAEVEYTYRGKKEMGNEVDGKAKAGAQSLFVNAYFDIYNSSPVTPYVGAGLGFAAVSTELEYKYYSSGLGGYGELKISETKTNFAWNIGAGAAWAINDSLSLDLGYRYADFGKATIDYQGVDIGDVKTSAHEVMLGLRIGF